MAVDAALAALALVASLAAVAAGRLVAGLVDALVLAGDLNYDSIVDILDIVLLVNLILID